MTQIEQELTALFEDAASRIQIRPLPVRSPRAVAINRILAAGVTAALVAGVVLMATRLGADSGNRGGVVTPAATQQLLDAVARTLGQPIRVESTFDSGHGAPQTTVIEEDVDRRQLVAYREGQPQFLLSGTHAYQGISDTERQLFSQLPASAQWVELPQSSRIFDAMMQSMAGVSVQQLTAVINSGRVSVTEVAEGTYRLSGSQPAPQGSTGADLETLHVNADGLLDWLKMHSDIPTGTGGPVVQVIMTAHISPLGHPIRINLPDPNTVIGQKAYETATNSGRTCSGTSSPSPSPSSNNSVGTATVQTCSISGSISVGRAKAKLRKR